MRLIAVAALLLAACSSSGIYKIELMPAPTVFAEGIVDPFQGSGPKGSKYGMLYATDRAPSESGKDGFRFYTNKRGRALRFGVARIEVTEEQDLEQPVGWEEGKRMTLSADREIDMHLQIKEIEEFGVYDQSAELRRWTTGLSGEPAKRFADAIDKRLGDAQVKDVYVYTHGYKTNFEFPVLVSSELWHFIGYEGVFVAYAWPAGQSALAYTADIETANQSARNMRLLLEFLSKRTKARRIHVIGYSAGTRVVMAAMGQLALLYGGRTKQQLARELRIGHVILVGADVDLDLTAGYLDDGLLDLCRSFTVYQSSADSPLGFSKWITHRKRLGQLFEGEQSKAGKRLMEQRRDLVVIDVTKAEGAKSGNGHGYFRKSPWASSDIALNLRYDKPPAKRGLVRNKNGIWTFPDDYVERLEKLFGKPSPE